MKSFATPNQWSYADLFSTGRTMSHKFSLLWLMLFTLLLLPTRMMAQTTTEDPRCALFNDLDGITDVTITDNGDYPWQMLDLKAEGMGNLGFTFPDESKVLMSSNYLVHKTTSETVVNFTVTKPILLTFKCLVSSEYWDRATVTLDNKAYKTISGKNQIEVKALLPIGKHSLKLSYYKNGSGSSYADRAFIYDLNTATSISDYVAEFNATNQTLTFKKISSDNLGNLDLNNIVIANNEPTVKNQCIRLGINNTTIKSVVFDKSFNTYALTSLKGFFSGCSNLETISGLDYLNTKNVTDMSYMFYDCIKLPSLDLSNFNTAKVTSMYSMFSGCNNLSSLILSNFNTANVTDMANMFDDCNKLSSLTLSESFNTVNVTNMTEMFKNCRELSSLDISKFNTAKVKYMSSMFYGCNKLSSLTFSESFNTAEVTNMSYMFLGCNKLSSLTLSESFNTAKVTNMSYMFYHCINLPSLNLSKFNTAKVKDMSYMFYECNKLTSLNLSHFNTAEVTNMSYMFRGCSQLPSLDLSNFNTAKVTNMSYMFSGSSTLQTIYVSDDFVVTGITNDNYKKNLFTICQALKGALPAYDATKTSSDYANYKTGYFTKLVVRNGNERYGITGETTQLTVDNLALADDKDLVVFDPFTATAATYNRTMKAGTTWATLCLPFEVTLDGQNFRAFKLLSADEGTNTVELEELTTSIEAGTPVIIKMNEGTTSLSFSVENTAIAKDIQTAATADGSYQLQGLYAQKEFSKDVDNNCYIVKGNQLMNPAKLLANTNVTKVASKPFRAYMVDNTSTPAAGAKMFSIGFNDNTTAIDNLNTIANDKAVYYDIQGLRLNAPQKGINIVKRGNKTMKVIIK